MTPDVISTDGRVITGAKLDELAARAARGEVLAGTPGEIHLGRPRIIGDDAGQPFTVRLDTARKTKIENLAATRGISLSQVFRDLVDAAPAI